MFSFPHRESQRPGALDGAHQGRSVADGTLIDGASASSPSAAIGTSVHSSVLERTIGSLATMVGEVNRHAEELSLDDALRQIGLKAGHIRFIRSREEQTNEPLTSIMRDLAFLTGDQIALVASLVSGHPHFESDRVDSLDISSVVNAGIRINEFKGFIPICLRGSQHSQILTVLIPEDRLINQVSIEFSEFLIEYQVASEDSIARIYRRHFGNTLGQFEDSLSKFNGLLKRRRTSANATQEADEDAAIYRRALLDLLKHACYQGASDLSITPTENGGMIRLKVGGTGTVLTYLTREAYLVMINIIKGDVPKADNVGVHPIDTTITWFDPGKDDWLPHVRPYKELGERYGFRLVLMMSTKNGMTENLTVTIRILDKQSTAVNFDLLGFDQQTTKTLKEYVNSKNGLVLVTGPTGSGKTTTLYALLNLIDPIERWVQTIENPIEYRNGLWFQYQIPSVASDESGGAETLLKGMLRNAPDVALIGEIRDRHIADVLVNMSNTGHLAFSTLHTNDAALALIRLFEFGIDPVSIASVLRGVLAQRLVRTLCNHCKEEDERNHAEIQSASYLQVILGDGKKIFRASRDGCAHCAMTGYVGRRMIYELLHVNPTVRAAIEEKKPPSAIAQLAMQKEENLRARGLRLVAQGLTSIEEVNSVAPAG